MLDAATGTGHVALAAARQFCETTGIDYVPALVGAARGRAEAEGLAVDFREGDAENLTFDEGAFDYVLSALGVMFTADHKQAAQELVRVCRPGGTIGLLSWTPTGFVGELGDGIAELSFRTGSITERFPSAEFFADFFIENYGPTRKASEALDDDGRIAFRRELADLAARTSRTQDGTAISDWEYLVAVARRA